MCIVPRPYLPTIVYINICTYFQLLVLLIHMTIQNLPYFVFFNSIRILLHSCFREENYHLTTNIIDYLS